MGLFDDFNQFLETQLEEYLRQNPHLELLVLEEKLREQEEQTLKLMTDLKRQESQLETEILSLAREVQLWHERITKAKAADRQDLAAPAEAHLQGLLRQGNQKWGQMEMLKARIRQTQELQQQVQVRRKEVSARVNQSRNTTQQSTQWQTQAPPETSSNTTTGRDLRDLEKQFQRWEAEEELKELKRQMGK